MTLKKAIELLRAIHFEGQYEGDPDDSDAIQLGIESLSLVVQSRAGYPLLAPGLLPGETIDE